MDIDVETYIENTSKIFSHLEDKDIFIEVYRVQLARWLLNDKVVFEFEKQFIGKIKMLCGTQYTSKLEGMISDMNLAEDVDKSFKNHSKDNLV